MGRERWRNQVVENSLLNRMDRAREGSGTGPSSGAIEEFEKKRLHNCQPGDWIRQVLQGANNYGPLLRVLDPKKGLLENRDGRRQHMQPRTQVVVQT